MKFRVKYFITDRRTTNSIEVEAPSQYQAGVDAENLLIQKYPARTIQILEVEEKPCD